jgi:hypothetical protein
MEILTGSGGKKVPENGAQLWPERCLEQVSQGFHFHAPTAKSRGGVLKTKYILDSIEINRFILIL